MQNEHKPGAQLATRIPKTLPRTMKLHGVQSDSSVMEFVVAVPEEKLARDQQRRARG